MTKILLGANKIAKRKKKWNLKALSNAIKEIEKYEKPIENGSQLKEIKGIGNKISKRIDQIIETGNSSELNKKEIDNDSFENLILITGVGKIRAKNWINLGKQFSLPRKFSKKKCKNPRGFYIVCNN